MEDSKRKQKLQVAGNGKKKKKKKTVFVLNNLTDEVLNNVLIRLPTNKEATRCKLVCKRWCSLLSTDNFVTASIIHHHDNDKTQLPFTLLFMREPTSLEYVEFFHAKGLSRRTVDLGFIYAGPTIHLSIILAASCGDLILLSYSLSWFPTIYYYICNIVTRQWVVLPETLGSGGVFGDSIGFLYEPLVNDDRHMIKCLVLRFFRRGVYCHDAISTLEVQIYSSDKGSWTNYHVMSPRIFDSSRSEASMIACGRMLYTLNYCDGNILNFIIACDPFTNDPDRLLCLIDLPLEARGLNWLPGKLGVCRGRLQFARITIEQNRYPCISVWELEDYRMGIWTLVHKRIPTNQALRIRLHRHGIKNVFSVLAFHPYNKDLICFLVSNDLIVVYNIRTDKVESSTRNSLFIYPPRSLAPDVLPTIQKWRPIPITQQWWPTPVRQSL